jgi:hypothetical protein
VFDYSTFQAQYYRLAFHRKPSERSPLLSL